MLPRFTPREHQVLQGTQGALVMVITGATEDAAARRVIVREKQACIAG
jgi:hypothetical protein